jgi:hypothetical protein
VIELSSSSVETARALSRDGVSLLPIQAQGFSHVSRRLFEVEGEPQDLRAIQQHVAAQVEAVAPFEIFDGLTGESQCKVDVAAPRRDLGALFSSLFSAPNGRRFPAATVDSFCRAREE